MPALSSSFDSPVHLDTRVVTWHPERHTIPRGRPSLVPDLVSRLEQAIVAGRFPAGRYLPSETDLATGFGVSRPTLRRALGVLEQRHLVQRQAGKGTLVLEPDAAPDDGRLRVIGVDINPVGVTGAYYRAMLLGLEEGLAPLRLRLSLLKRDEVLHGRIEDCDALAVMGLDERATTALGRISETGRPVVAFNRRFDDPRLATVGVDYAAEAQRATPWLLAQSDGPVVYSGAGSGAKSQRLAGCRLAAEAHGRSLIHLDQGAPFPIFADRIDDLLERTPDAVFFAEDASALGRLLAVLSRRSDRRPVLCFDEARTYSEEFAYPLAQVLMPLEEIGRRGGRWLRDRLLGRSIPPLRTLLQAEVCLHRPAAGPPTV